MIIIEKIKRRTYKFFIVFFDTVFVQHIDIDEIVLLKGYYSKLSVNMSSHEFIAKICADLSDHGKKFT